MAAGIWVRHRTTQHCPGKVVPRAGFAAYDEIERGGATLWAKEAGETDLQAAVHFGTAHHRHSHPHHPSLA